MGYNFEWNSWATLLLRAKDIFRYCLLPQTKDKLFLSFFSCSSFLIPLSLSISLSHCVVATIPLFHGTQKVPSFLVLVFHCRRLRTIWSADDEYLLRFHLKMYTKLKIVSEKNVYGVGGDVSGLCETKIESFQNSTTQLLGIAGHQTFDFNMPKRVPCHPKYTIWMEVYIKLFRFVCVCVSLSTANTKSNRMGNARRNCCYTTNISNAHYKWTLYTRKA